MIFSPLGRLKTTYDNLNDRERKLVGVLGSVLALVIVLLPFWLINESILEIEEENETIRDVLRDVSRSRDEIALRQAERAAAERRYDTPAPPLGGFIEGRAREAGYDSPLQVTDQPDKVTDNFTRRHVRATLPNVGLRTAIDMLASIENSEFPIAIEQLHVDHTVMGQDRFNVQVGILAFDRRSDDEDSGGDGDEERRPAKRSAGRVGPPAP